MTGDRAGLTHTGSDVGVCGGRGRRIAGQAGEENLSEWAKGLGAGVEGIG